MKLQYLLIETINFETDNNAVYFQIMHTCNSQKAEYRFTRKISILN